MQKLLHTYFCPVFEGRNKNLLKLFQYNLDLYQHDKNCDNFQLRKGNVSRLLRITL